MNQAYRGFIPPYHHDELPHETRHQCPCGLCDVSAIGIVFGSSVHNWPGTSGVDGRIVSVAYNRSCGGRPLTFGQICFVQKTGAIVIVIDESPSTQSKPFAKAFVFCAQQSHIERQMGHAEVAASCGARNVGSSQIFGGQRQLPYVRLIRPTALSGWLSNLNQSLLNKEMMSYW